MANYFFCCDSLTNSINDLLSAGDIFSAVLDLMVGLSIGIAAFAIIMLITQFIIFKKAGKQGWAAFVPIYNMWVLLEIVGIPSWLCLVPIVQVFALLIANYKLAAYFGKSAMFGIGLIIMPYIFFPILAFGKAKPKVDAVNYSQDNQLSMQESPIQMSDEEPAFRATPMQTIQPSYEPPKPIQTPVEQRQMPVDTAQNIPQSDKVESGEMFFQPDQFVVPTAGEQTKQQNEITQKVCPNCGMMLDISAPACFMCGTKL